MSTEKPWPFGPKNFPHQITNHFMNPYPPHLSSAIWQGIDLCFVKTQQERQLEYIR